MDDLHSPDTARADGTTAETEARRRRGRPPGRGKGEAAPGGGRRDTTQVQAIHRALRLLEAMSEAPQGIALTALAETADLAPSTTHRLLKSLEQMRFVQHDDERSLWLIGVNAFAVGNAFLEARDHVAIARPFMRRLMEESGESVNLAVLDDGAAVYLSQVECREMMRALARPGGRAPLHASGVGKALLAARPVRERRTLIGRTALTAFTDKTVADADALHAVLDATARRGWAIDDEEYAPGLRCVAAPLWNEHGEPVAAVSLSGPSARVTDERLAELGALAARTAAEITAAMGGRQPESWGKQP